METGFFDYDNDGWLDLLILNGAVRIMERLAREGERYPLQQRNQLFRNTGRGAFVEVTDRAGDAFKVEEVSRGAAFGDVDNDGDTDVVVFNNNGRARLLLNEYGNRGHWLGLRLLEKRTRQESAFSLEEADAAGEMNGAELRIEVEIVFGGQGAGPFQRRTSPRTPRLGCRAGRL